MDEKYCIKRTKMNKKGHFAYNLGIWLGLLNKRVPHEDTQHRSKNIKNASPLIFAINPHATSITKAM